MVETCAWAKASPSALSICFPISPRRDALSRSTIRSVSQAARLQVGIHVGDLRYVLQRHTQLLRPVAQFGQIIAQQCVLVLRNWRERPPPPPMSCTACRKIFTPVDLCELRAQPRDHLIGRDRRIGQRLERDGDIGACAAAAEGPKPPPPTEPATRVDRRIGLDDRAATCCSLPFII